MCTGIRVGHVQRQGRRRLADGSDRWSCRRRGTVGSVEVQGGGPATHETDALDPTTLVAAGGCGGADRRQRLRLGSPRAGAQRWCEEDGRGFAVARGVVPIVPAAAIFDLGRGGDFSLPVRTPDMGYAATAAAAARPEGHVVERGNVGSRHRSAHRQGAVQGRSRHGLGHAGERSGCRSTGHSECAGTSFRHVRRRCERAPVRELEAGTVASERRGLRLMGRSQPGSARTPRSSWSPPMPCSMRRSASGTAAAVPCRDRPGPQSIAHPGGRGHGVLPRNRSRRPWTARTEAARQLSLVTLQSAAADVVRLAILDGVARAEPVRTPAGDYGAYGGQMR